ncbi:cytochrome c heme lyase subunit CcmL [Klebsiella pneumoniae]|nr:cytochrome c heme lyase subunit CcmL [Klebsiella pneumoniae]
MRGVMVILLALMLTGQAWAAIDTWQFKDAAEGVRADAAG